MRQMIMSSLSPWLPNSRGNMVGKNDQSNYSYKKNATSGNSKDVIIVGAGVAGSALAYTFGKMIMSSSAPTLPNSRGNIVRKNNQSISYNPKDVIIVGAGVAGSALAYSLGKDGYRVHLVERNLKEPNRISGEILQPGGYLKLVELGLEDCIDHEIVDAQTTHGFVVHHKGKIFQFPYSPGASGRTFHNGRFVQRLRTKATSLSNVQLEQGTVTSLIESGGTIKGVEYKTKTGQCIELHAPLTIVCDGCVSNLRTSLSKNPKADTLSYFAALSLGSYRLPQANFVHFAKGPSYLVFYAISSTEVRCMVDIPGPKPPSISNGDMARYLKTKVAPQVPLEFYDAFISAIDRGGIRAMPCKSMSATPSPLPGAILLGDALNMRHPTTGGGMMCALRDVVLLRDLLKPLPNLSNTTELSRCIQLFYNSRKARAFVVNAVAEAFYPNFYEKNDEIWDSALYYTSLGEMFSRGPVSLLSGEDQCPLELALSLSALATVITSGLLLSNPFPVGLWATGRYICDGMAILGPILADGVKDLYFNDFKFPENQDVPS